REVLESSEETRRRVSGRFRHVFLDEFQDTNPLQSAIVDRLRGGRSFFVVGDSQQSIYGFRDADAGILAEFRERAQSQGGHMVLRQNFRSRSELVEFTNRLFSSSLWRETSERFAKMVAASEHDRKSAPSVEIIRSAGEDAGRARQSEAQTLAGRIAELV